MKELGEKFREKTVVRDCRQFRVAATIGEWRQMNVE